MDQSAPLATDRTNSVGFALSQLGLETARQFSDVVGRFGLEPRHFAVLYAVDANEGHSQQSIGDHLAIPASTMVGIVDHLEETGLLERRHHASDRRTRSLHLTARGASLLLDALDAATAQEVRICTGLTTLERRELLDLLRRVSSNLDISPAALPDRGSGERPTHV